MYDEVIGPMTYSIGLGLYVSRIGADYPNINCGVDQYISFEASKSRSYHLLHFIPTIVSNGAIMLYLDDVGIGEVKPHPHYSCFTS